MWFLGPCDFLNCLYLNSNLTLSILLSPVNLSWFRVLSGGYIHTYLHSYKMYILYWLVLFDGAFLGILIMHGGRVEGEGKHPIEGMGR